MCHGVRRSHRRSPPAWELIHISAPDLPADTVCRRQGPAGADQSAATERIAIFFLRLKPHRHLPWPRGPDREREKMSINIKVSLPARLLDLHGQFLSHQDKATDLDILYNQPQHVFLPLVPPLALILRQLPQPTAQLLRLGLCRRLPRRDVTPHPCILPAFAALDALAQRGTLSQELLLPRAPHPVQVDGPFPLTKPSSCYCSTTEDGEKC